MTTPAFEEIKKKYGYVGSWAIWKEKDGKEKTNVGDMSVFESVTESLNPNVVFIGLNISEKIPIPFGNFHSASPKSHDYKIRYATKDTPFCGAYMTDIIKDFEDKSSGNVMKFIKKNSDFLQENIASFTEELEFIGATDPVLIAFGDKCYEILKKSLKHTGKLFKVPHYSYTGVSKEQLKVELQKIHEIIRSRPSQ